MGDSTDIGDCHPCPRTNLSPMSSPAHTARKLRVSGRRIKIIFTHLQDERVWAAHREVFSNPNRRSRLRLHNFALDDPRKALKVRKRSSDGVVVKTSF